MLGRILSAAFVLILSAGAATTAERTVRVGLLKSGTVAWEIDTMRHHGFDRAHGFGVVPTEFATNEAAKIALQTAAVDMIVTDWPWVNRQRAEGADFTFVPYSKAVGAIVLPVGSPLRTLDDLRGRRIGVVGGPLDKSWLLLRALGYRELGADLATLVEPVFGAQPLLQEQLTRGRIDALLTYWHHAARLEASGARPLMTVAELLGRLGVTKDLPMLGYAFREEWAARNGDLVRGFVEASRATKVLMANAPDEWARLDLGTSNPAVLVALQRGFSAGVPGRWGLREQEEAAQLYSILAGLGGEMLVGTARALDPRTFWHQAD